MHGRHRLGHRPQLHLLRPALQRRDQPDVRRRADVPRRRPLLADRREVQSHRFYTAPTAIRSLIRLGEEWPNKYDLGTLRVLGSVGEPINPEAWMWYHRVIGKERCPIVDTWWQTETGGHSDHAAARRAHARSPAAPIARSSASSRSCCATMAHHAARTKAASSASRNLGPA